MKPIIELPFTTDVWWQKIFNKEDWQRKNPLLQSPNNNKSNTLHTPKRIPGMSYSDVAKKPPSDLGKDARKVKKIQTPKSDKKDPRRTY